MGVFCQDDIPAPGRRVVGGQASEGGLEVLVEPLRLTIRLRMKARGETDGGPNQFTKGPPEARSELGPTIRDYV